MDGACGFGGYALFGERLGLQAWLCVERGMFTRKTWSRWTDPSREVFHGLKVLQANNCMFTRYAIVLQV